MGVARQWRSLGASIVGEQVEQRGVGGQRLGALPGAGERADGGEFAEEDPADQPVVADDDLAVGAAGGVGELDDVVAGAGGRLAEGGEVEGGRVGGAARVRRVRARVPV